MKPGVEDYGLIGDHERKAEIGECHAQPEGGDVEELETRSEGRGYYTEGRRGEDGPEVETVIVTETEWNE